jgi:uncharacterized membrane protein YcaP (DUF421 family)
MYNILHTIKILAIIHCVRNITAKPHNWLNHMKIKDSHITTVFKFQKQICTEDVLANTFREKWLCQELTLTGLKKIQREAPQHAKVKNQH